MWRWLKWPFRLFALLLVVGLGWFLHEWNFKPWSLRFFYERAFIQYAIDDPQMLSSMRMLPSWLDWYSDDLTDVSLARQDTLRQKLKDDYETLKSYDREALTEEEKLSYDVLDYFLATQLEGDPFRFHNYPANQLFGFQNGLPTFMATQHPVRSVGDAEDYNARLEKFPTYFEQQMEGVRLRVDKGIVPPRFVVEKVLQEAKDFVAAKPDENMLYATLVDKLDKIEPAIEAGQRQRILTATKQRIERSVYPAMQTLVDYYQELLPKARPNNGVWDLPQGEAFYAYQVREHTSTTMTPEEVHQLGLAEVARIEAEMNEILVGEGLIEGTIGERVDQISQRPDQLYEDSDAGREQILADYQKIIDEIDAGLDPYFGVRPKIGVEVKRVPEFREKTAPGAYYNAPAFDGSRPGVFYANLRSVKEVAKFGMRTLAYHEAIPGHHFQTTIQQELTGVPMFRKILGFTAFSEGWALYAERLAWEIGYQENPLDNLGRLQAEMFRAVRLVVDTGLHHKQWTREQAIDYMREKTGMPPTDVVAEIERYIVMPGQALAYKVGMNTILRLREEAKTELGDKFDLKGFHDVVLTGGDLPLTLLERLVKAWVADEKA
ncbi:DUF885 domain-containing protein [Pseudomarimonas arenosa]|uniref:DUF885 domain-containing protein n=1 Tax=Pseudomarimonas arenosa TaxID=2774145 RepID=A0AAW3ZK01_9GAMM|nr:DUF885 domain-containing protein [Pseudomarimonas arenosa]MBD8526410.1 DUF885 domain-containing protein [Pseudomarimonas arenosa]